MKEKHECSDGCQHDHVPSASQHIDPATLVPAIDTPPISTVDEVPELSAKEIHDRHRHLHLLHRQEKSEKRLRFNNYETISKNYTTAFVVQDQRTGLIAEVRAASGVHACTLLGWNPNRVKILSTKDIVDEPVTNKTEPQAEDPQSLVRKHRNKAKRARRAARS